MRTTGEAWLHTRGEDEEEPRSNSARLALDAMDWITDSSPLEGDNGRPMKWTDQLGWAAVFGMLVGAAWAQAPQELYIGQMVAEQLTEGDAATPGGGVCDICEFVGEQGQPIVISLRSDDFDAHLRVTTPGGQRVVNDNAELGTTNARIEMTLPENGRYTVTISSRDPEGRGMYRFSVMPAEEVSTPQHLSLNAPTSPMGETGTPIALEETLNGVLEPGDPISADGKYEDLYIFEGTMGQTVAVGMASRFDTLIHVITPSGERLTDDDSGAGTNSRIILTISEAGPHRIMATSAAASVTGPYSVRVIPATALRTAPPGQVRQRAAGQLVDDGPMTIGESIRGQINPQDARLPSGEYYDIYTFDGVQGQGVEVSLESPTFDTYIVVVSPTGQQSDNDDSGEGFNSAIRMSLPETGQWAVIATTYGVDEFGDYTLSLRPIDLPPNSPGGEITIGQPVQGILGLGDLRDSSGSWCDEYTLEVEAGQQLSIRMATPGDFDTYLIYLDPSGYQEENDDLGNMRTSGLDVTVRTSGTAHIGASSLFYRFMSSSEGGRYTLMVNEVGGGASSTGGGSAELLTVGSETSMVVPGQTVTGQLSPGDHLSTGRFVEGFWFRGRAGQTLEIVMESTEFDPTVYLQMPDGQILAGDPDGDESCLNVQLPTTARYTIMCTSESERASGPFTLTLR